MDDKLAELIRALSPVMNPVQAEGFLHVTAFTRRKPLEALTFDDWPAVELAVREALEGTSAADRADLVCDHLRDVFLRSSESADC